MNNQNESPFTNPKFLIAIAVTFLSLWGWQYYMTKNYPVAGVAVNSAGPKEIKDLPPSSVASKPDEAVNKFVENSNLIREAKEFLYEDEKVSWTISSVGMGLKSFTLKSYKDRNNQPINYSAADPIFGSTVNDKKIFFSMTQISDVEFKGEAIVEDKKIIRTIVYDKNKMSFDSKITFEKGFQKLSFAMNEKKLIHKNTNFLMPSFERQDFLYKTSEGIKTENISDLKDSVGVNKIIGNVTLAAIGTQYFALAGLDKSEITPSLKMSANSHDATVDIFYDLSNSQIQSITQVFYVGAKDTNILSQIDPVMLEVMDYGMFGFIAKPLLVLMRFMHQVLGNWGLAIIGLTLIVRLILLPFNILSFKSSQALQKIQPLLKDVRERYKSDPLEVNRRTMAIMKENKANPLSGCLPMLIQIPIFFALWKTIGSSIEIYQQPFFGWISDLSSYDAYFVIPILMGITMYFQQKLTPTTMDPAQQKILNFMPIIFTVFMFSLPSGLTLYNFISALFGVVQQYFLLKNKPAVATA